jgi:hypothetical protein
MEITEEGSIDEIHGIVTLKTALPEYLVVFNVTLTVPSDDIYKANYAALGFRYLFLREFAKQEPVLSLLYDVDIQLLNQRTGSTIFDFEIKITLKIDLDKVLKTLHAVKDTLLIITTLSAMLSMPPNLIDASRRIEKCRAPVEEQLQIDQPSAPSTLHFADFKNRPVNKDRPGTGSFNL